MSSLEIGIVGLPNVGKSTLYNALTKNNALAANYPFATIEPNIGIVAVPDPRLQKLADIYGTTNIIPATIKFIDIAGLVEGASKGDGMGNKFLSHIRECSVICQVVRAFDDSNVIHANDANNPKTDIDIINTELVLSDLATIEKRIQTTIKLAKSDTKIALLLAEYNKVLKYLESNTPLFDTSDIDFELLKDLNLLTAKKIIYLFNVDEATLQDNTKQDKLRSLIPNHPVVFINAQLESELNGLSIDEAKELLSTYGQQESGLEQLITQAYKTLGLQSYLTAGPKEVRAWTINKGATAPQAAGVIHTDFEKGFIAAQIVDYEDLIKTESMTNAKAKGLVRTEGKTYVMQPNDIVEFRFNN
ncbi:MAG TPA: redox-regulated ATPase YchF [Candidatus Saccharimonadales bacterium]